MYSIRVLGIEYVHHRTMKFTHTHTFAFTFYISISLGPSLRCIMISINKLHCSCFFFGTSVTSSRRKILIYRSIEISKYRNLECYKLLYIYKCIINVIIFFVSSRKLPHGTFSRTIFRRRCVHKSTIFTIMQLWT